MTITDAKCVALGHYTKDENQSVFVTFPDKAIYLNNSLDVMEEFAKRSNKTLVVVKLDGKIVSDSDTEVSEDVQEETVEETVKKFKKKQS